MGLKEKFTEHPASVDETYLEHMGVAARMSGNLLKAALCAAIHALFPWKHCTTASTKIKELHEVVTTGARADDQAEVSSAQ
jgi:hypothetical protein